MKSACENGVKKTWEKLDWFEAGESTLKKVYSLEQQNCRGPIFRLILLESV